MKTLLLTLSLVILLSLNLSAQSGRRHVAPPSATPAPIQPPVNPEPEIKPATTAALPELLMLSESFREREIKAIDSTSFKLSDFQGKVVVINLWASWCGPCRREVPEYEKVRKAYAGREVEFIGLTTEDPRASAERVNKFLREVNFGFRLGWADRETARTLMNGKTSIPQTLVLDGAGHVVRHWTGFAPAKSADRLRQTIDRALLGG